MLGVSGEIIKHAEKIGFWVHVDADVLDDTIVPFVDYRLPGGLSWEELTTTLRIAIESRRVAGVELTIYNRCSIRTAQVRAD